MSDDKSLFSALVIVLDFATHSAKASATVRISVWLLKRFWNSGPTAHCSDSSR